MAWEIRTMWITRNPLIFLFVVLVLALVYLLYVFVRYTLGMMRARKVDDAPESSTRKGQYQFNICLIGDKHTWMVIRKDEMVFTHSIGDTSYEIETKDLYEIQPGILDRIRWKMKGIKTAFIIIFDSKDKPVGYEAPELSAYVLKTIEESRALSNALKDEFKTSLDVKTAFIYIVILVVVIVVYLALTGQIQGL